MKLYLDTSVFGGYFDKEFEKWTIPLIEDLRAGIHQAVISDLTILEMEPAPQRVSDLMFKMIDDGAMLIQGNKESENLANMYVSEGGLTDKSIEDANHIAMATLHHVDVLISWNFKHIVNLNRIRIFNSVNLRHGHQNIEIRSPLEISRP
ncbi:MAG: PIN domain protein [Flavobacteriales bacterium]|nr:PIN domain protein [Flavobacteriales bacterium]